MKLGDRGVLNKISKGRISVFLPAKKTKDHCSGYSGSVLRRWNQFQRIQTTCNKSKKICLHSSGGVKHSLIRTQAYKRARKEPGDRHDMTRFDTI